MKIKFLLISFLVLLSTLTLQAKQPDMISLNSDENLQIIVHNRVLANVNGKPITLIDVMKKMDMIFYRQFPEYATSKSARYQFYMVNWKSFLEELINKELILADAEEVKLPISNGDVRQEMESMFGPNIIGNLDKIGMTMDEALKIIKGDITLRRMMIYRVNSKALGKISPQEVKTAYEQYLKDNQQSDIWDYRVISIRNKDAEKGSQVAQAIEGLIKDNHGSFDDLAKKVKEMSDIGKSTVNISEEIKHNEEQLSKAYKEILADMKDGTYSAAISQKSRADRTTVYRIFYLKGKAAGVLPNYNEIEPTLKGKLLDEAVAKETESYLKRLRKHFAVSDKMIKEMIPENYQPFTLQ